MAQENQYLSWLKIPLEQHDLHFIGELTRWFSGVTRQDIGEADLAQRFCREFRINWQETRFTRRHLKVLKGKEVDKLYEELTYTLLESNSFHIYNHSSLPLCSQMDPFARAKPWYSDFCGLLDTWKQVKNRALYFETEEALITGSWARVNRLVNEMGKSDFKGQPIIGEIKKTRRKAALGTERLLTLYRAASIVSGAEYEHAKKIHNIIVKRRILARYASIVAQLYRLRGRSKHHYTLNLFPTVATQSVPTTLYAGIGDGDEDEHLRGIWGFLRTPGGRRNSPFRDRFIVADNHAIVDVWKEHVDEYLGENKVQRGVKTVFANDEAYLDVLFDIIGYQAGRDLLSFLKELKLSYKSGKIVEDCAGQAALKWYARELERWNREGRNI